MPQKFKGVGFREGCPLPNRGWVWGGGSAPSPEFFKFSASVFLT